MKYLLLLSAITLSHLALSQELKELRHAKTADFKSDFYVSFSEKEIKYEDTLHYHWFKSQKVHVTQGNSEGRVLDGSFTKFYHSGQMAEKGVFKKGLRDGEWKSWFESGKLRSIYNYNSGLLTGKYSLFNEAGDIRESGKIRKGEKDADVAKEEKVKKPKKERDTPIGTFRPDKEKLQERADKKEERLRERKKRQDEKGGSFIERFFKIKKTDKKKKPKKNKSKKENKKRD